MHYVKVTIFHQPDAGQHSSSRFTYQDLLDNTDASTAREFAFKALGEGNARKGRITVVFPETASFSFRFERAGLVGYKLTRTRDQPTEALLV